MRSKFTLHPKFIIAAGLTVAAVGFGGAASATESDQSGIGSWPMAAEILNPNVEVDWSNGFSVTDKTRDREIDRASDSVTDRVTDRNAVTSRVRPTDRPRDAVADRPVVRPEPVRPDLTRSDLTRPDLTRSDSDLTEREILRQRCRLAALEWTECVRLWHIAHDGDDTGLRDLGRTRA
jgi:hypothetical protein